MLLAFLIFPSLLCTFFLISAGEENAAEGPPESAEVAAEAGEAGEAAFSPKDMEEEEEAAKDDQGDQGEGKGRGNM